MNKTILVCAAMCLVVGMGEAHAWLVDTTANLTTNSDNRRDEVSVGDNGAYLGNSANHNYNQKYNQKYDNRQDKSVRYSDSFNKITDNRNLSDNRKDNSIKDSFNVFDSSDSHNQDLSTNVSEIVGGNKRINSSDVAIKGNVRNSVLGNFDQLYNGTDIRSGVTGDNNTIDTSSVNLTTFGDTVGK